MLSRYNDVHPISKDCTSASIKHWSKILTCVTSEVDSQGLYPKTCKTGLQTQGH